MHAQQQIPLSFDPRQSIGVNLLQPQALRWLQTRAQNNMHCHSSQNCQVQQPYSHAQPAYSHAQPPYNHVQPPYIHAQPPYIPELEHNLNYFVPLQSVETQPTYNNFSPQWDNYMQPLYRNQPTLQWSQVNCSPVLSPDKPYLNAWCTEPNVNMHASNNSVDIEIPTASCQSQLPSPNGKHVYMNGALYNAELLDLARTSLEDKELPQEESDDETYDPFEDNLPPVYGIRFYNPNYGPEGAVPERSDAKKKKVNRKSKIRTGPFVNTSEAHVPNVCPLHPMNFMTNTEDGIRNNISQQVINVKSEQNLTETGSVTHGFQDEITPGSKAKHHRRQGRCRSRGFTQSFGIVAPINRNSQSANGNAMAKNVLSLFDKK